MNGMNDAMDTLSRSYKMCSARALHCFSEETTTPAVRRKLLTTSLHGGH